MPNLLPFFTYYGGKWRIAPHYPPPALRRLIEPFAGSAGYALRHSAHDVHLNDLDPTIAGVWDYLIHAPEREVRALPLTGSITNLPAEAQALIGFWFNKGSAAPGRTPSAWMRSEIRPNSYWGEVIRERIAAQQRHIRHWVVTCQSYETLPNATATWFIDPPYSAPAGRLYRFSGIDYPALAEWCIGRAGQAIVCESAGADWLPFAPFREAKASESRTGGKRSHEVVWYNRA